MADTHLYPVLVEWTGGRSGSGSVTAQTSGESVGLAVPSEFGGAGGSGNPEELLAMAIAGCYSVTFGIIAENRKIPLQDLKVEAVGEVEQAGMQFTYKKVTIKPTITVSADIDEATMKMAEDMAHKADLYCIITNAVRDKLEIVVEPTFVKG